MEVKDYIAYHIKKVNETNNYNIGDFITQQKRTLSDFKDNKNTIEEIFERVRETRFPALPSRLSALFVCSNEENIDTWAYYKYGRNKIEYYIFELSLTGSLYWVDARYYNESVANISGISVNKEKAAFSYWTSESNKDTINNEEVEGLFIGEAKIVNVVKKMHLA